jgi:hypothetical protein
MNAVGQPAAAVIRQLDERFQSRTHRWAGMIQALGLTGHDLKHALWDTQAMGEHTGVSLRGFQLDVDSEDCKEKNLNSGTRGIPEWPGHSIAPSNIGTLK